MKNWLLFLFLSITINGFTKALPDSIAIANSLEGPLVLHELDSTTVSRENQELADKIRTNVETARRAGTIIYDLMSLNYLSRMPAILSREIQGNKYEILLDKLEFTPAGNTISMFAMVTTSDGKEIFFEGNNVKFSGHGGFHSGTLRLIVDNKNVANAFSIGEHIKMKLTGGGFTFDCNGFKSLSLAGKVIFDRALMIPENPVTEKRLEGQVQSTFSIDGILDWDDMLIEISMQPFQLTKMEEGWGFQVKNAVIDLSETKNSIKFALPKGYLPARHNEDWTGVHIGKVQMRFPKNWKQHDSTKTDHGRIVVGVDDLIVDKYGLSGHFYGKNILETGAGKMGGWDYSINGVDVQLVQSQIKSGSITGTIRTSINEARDSMSYKALIDPIQSTYLFSVEILKKHKFPIFVASDVTLDPTSQITIRFVNKKMIASALLTGKLSIGSLKEGPDGTKLKDPSVAMKDVFFERLSLSTVPPYIGIGVLYFDRAAKEDEEKAPALAKFPITISSFNVSKIPDLPSVLSLNFIINVNLDDKLGNSKGSFNAAGSFSVLGELVTKSTGRQHWVYKDTKINGLTIDANVNGFIVTGGILFFREDPIYGQGFKGGIKLTLPTPSMSISTHILFGNIEKPTKYRYWYVDGIAEGLSIPIVTPVIINSLGGGLFRKMYQTADVTKAGSDIGKFPSGLFYVPSPTVSWGAKFIVGLGTKPAGSVSVTTTYEVTANTSGGIETMGLIGLVRFVVSADELIPSGLQAIQDKLQAIARKIGPEKQGEIAKNAKAMTPQDAFATQIAEALDGPALKPNEVRVEASLSMIYSFSEDVFTGQIWANSYPKNLVDISGLGTFRFGAPNWYVKIGTPTSRFKMAIFNTIKVDSYLMIGHDIPNIAVPKFFEDYKDPSLPYKNGISLTAAKDGSGFAHGASLTVKSTGGIKASTLVSYLVEGSAGYDLMVTKHAQGSFCKNNNLQNFGMNGWRFDGDIWAYLGIDIRVVGMSILQASVGAIIVGQGPNPGHAMGQFKLKTKVGFKKKSYSSSFSVGEACDYSDGVVEEKDNNFLVSSFPLDNDKDVFPYLTPNIVLGEENMKEQFSDEDKKYFRLNVTRYEIREAQTQTLVKAFKSENISSDNKKISFKDMALKPETEYEMVFECAYEVSESNAWKVAQQNGVNQVQRKIFKFTTGTAPTSITKASTETASPEYDEYAVYKSTLSEIKIKAKFPLEKLINGGDLTANLIDKSGKKIPVVVTLNGEKELVFSPISGLDKGKIYQLDLKSSTNELPLLDNYYFRTSLFDNFEDKAADVAARLKFDFDDRTGKQRYGIYKASLAGTNEIELFSENEMPTVKIATDRSDWFSNSVKLFATNKLSPYTFDKEIVFSQSADIKLNNGEMPSDLKMNISIAPLDYVQDKYEDAMKMSAFNNAQATTPSSLPYSNTYNNIYDFPAAVYGLVFTNKDKSHSKSTEVNLSPGMALKATNKWEIKVNCSKGNKVTDFIVYKFSVFEKQGSNLVSMAYASDLKVSPLDGITITIPSGQSNFEYTSKQSVKDVCVPQLNVDNNTRFKVNETILDIIPPVLLGTAIPIDKYKLDNKVEDDAACAHYKEPSYWRSGTSSMYMREYSLNRRTKEVYTDDAAANLLAPGKYVVKEVGSLDKIYLASVNASGFLDSYVLCYAPEKPACNNVTIAVFDVTDKPIASGTNVCSGAMLRIRAMGGLPSSNSFNWTLGSEYKTREISYRVPDTGELNFTVSDNEADGCKSDGMFKNTSTNFKLNLQRVDQVFLNTEVQRDGSTKIFPMRDLDSYEWYKDGVEITGRRNDKFILIDRTSGAGKYTVKIKAVCGLPEGFSRPLDIAAPNTGGGLGGDGPVGHTYKYIKFRIVKNSQMSADDIKGIVCGNVATAYMNVYTDNALTTGMNVFSTDAGGMAFPSNYVLLHEDSKSIYALDGTTLTLKRACQTCNTSLTLTADKTTICDGSNVVLTAAGCTGGDLTWADFANGNASNTGTKAQTYKVSCKVETCTTIEKSVTVAAIPAPVVSRGTQSSVLSVANCLAADIVWEKGSETLPKPSPANEYHLESGDYGMFRVNCANKDCPLVSSPVFVEQPTTPGTTPPAIAKVSTIYKTSSLTACDKKDEISNLYSRSGILNMQDYVFQDLAGSKPASDGFLIRSQAMPTNGNNYSVYEITNGMVKNFGNCPAIKTYAVYGTLSGTERCDYSTHLKYTGIYDGKGEIIDKPNSGVKSNACYNKDDLMESNLCNTTTYLRRNVYSNGSGGSYSTDIAGTYTVDCGGIPYGRELRSNCDATSYQKTTYFANGSGGEYTNVAFKSPACGYVLPNNTFIKNACSGNNYCDVVANGYGGEKFTNCAYSVANCGGEPYGKPAGGHECEGFQKFDKIHDGKGNVIRGPSLSAYSTDCGGYAENTVVANSYVCNSTTHQKFQKLHDGKGDYKTGGGALIQNYSSDCGGFAENAVVDGGYVCDNNTHQKFQQLHDGNGGYKASGGSVLENYSATCGGYAKGADAGSMCENTTEYKRYHDGKGDYYRGYKIADNSTNCGYTVPKPAAGTFLRSGCEENEFCTYTADGSGGETKSCENVNGSCGYYYPAGTRVIPIQYDCRSGYKYYKYWDGEGNIKQDKPTYYEPCK